MDITFRDNLKYGFNAAYWKQTRCICLAGFWPWRHKRNSKVAAVSVQTQYHFTNNASFEEHRHAVHYCKVRLRLEDGCGCIVSIAPCTLLCKQDLAAWCEFWSAPDLPHCIMKWDWGQRGWTGPIVCWGEGVIGVRRFGLLEGGSPLWMERKERRAGQSQPLGIRVELEWPTPRIRWLPEQSSAGIQSRTFFVKVRLDGFPRTCDAGYFDPVPTQYLPADRNLWCNLCLCLLQTILNAAWEVILLPIYYLLMTAPAACSLGIKALGPTLFGVEFSTTAASLT